MARNLPRMEVRPLGEGAWAFEGHRATFEGLVEIVLRSQHPLASMLPTRFQVPMIYVQHVPAIYTRHDPPHSRPTRFQRRAVGSPRVPYTTSRAYRASFSRVRSRPSATRDFPEGCGPNGRRDVGNGPREEDPVEGEDPEEPTTSGDVDMTGD